MLIQQKNMPVSTVVSADHPFPTSIYELFITIIIDHKKLSLILTILPYKQFSNFSRTTSRSHSITGIIIEVVMQHRGKQKSQVLKVITSDLSPTSPTIFSYASCQLLPSQFKKQCKCETENILLWYQYLYNT